MYNPFKWHIVQRSDDKGYGVRKLYWFFPFFFMYVDFSWTNVHWSRLLHNSDKWFHRDCFTEHLDIAENYLEPKKTKYKLTVIKPEGK